MHTTLYSFAAVALCTAFAGSAHGDCGPSGAARQAPLLRLLGTLETRAVDRAKAVNASAGASDSNASIVGLWDVTFFSPPDTLFDEGYDQFHSDGTEMLNDIPNPAAGNVCLGVFVQTGPLTYSLHHVYWNWDEAGNLSGKGIWDSILTLDKSGNSYTGTWTMTNVDLSGNKIASGPLAPTSGTLKANRIAVPNAAVTRAVANPKNVTATLREFILDGTASTSADGQPLSYSWSLAQDSLPAWMTQGNTATPLVGFAAGHGPYTFVLTVTDSTGNTATDTVTVNFAGI
jgi:hypothetical protein